MSRSNLLIAAIVALCPLWAGADSKWQFAGESQGISFQLQIRNECKDGSKVSIKLKSELDHAATVTFRLNDSDWRKTFTYKVKPKGKESTLSYDPPGATVCHPYIDQVYIEDEQEVVTQGSEDASGH